MTVIKMNANGKNDKTFRATEREMWHKHHEKITQRTVHKARK